MEPTELPRHRQPRGLAAFGAACIVLGALILYQSRISPSAPEASATTTTVDGLRLTLQPTHARPGPITLTIDVRDTTGSPVAGATVTLSAVSLEMDMEAIGATATETEAGRYVARDVPLKHVGAWAVDVAIAVPGLEPVTARMALTVTDS